MVNQYLGGGVSVVIEAAFQHRIWSARIDAIAARSRTLLVLCEIDAEEAGRRHLARGLLEPGRTYFHGDARVTQFLEHGTLGEPGPYEPPRLDVPTLTVDTSGSGGAAGSGEDLSAVLDRVAPDRGRRG